MNRPTLLFIANIDSSLHDGISKKILEQSTALSTQYDVKLVLIPTVSGCDNIYAWLQGYIASIYECFRYRRASITYIRNLTGICSILFFPVLVSLQFKRVYIDIPTYPIEPNRTIVSHIDAILKRTFFRFFVTRIFAVGLPLEKIWGVFAVPMNNCIDVQARPTSRLSPDNNPMYRNYPIRLISVSSFAPWHGTARLINSLSIYRHLPIQVVFVGFGPEYQKSLDLSIKLGLTSHIMFAKTQHGNQLDRIFDTVHIGVDSLSRSQTNHKVNQSLKSREYCSRGIPFIKAHSDPIFDDQEFSYTVSSDDSCINLEHILEWYTKLCNQPTPGIRNFALQNFCWTLEYSRLGLFDSVS